MVSEEETDALDETDLIAAARDIQEQVYAPYSNYRVGAALETASGEIYVGCNFEVVNYSNSLHAEEVALANALTDGHRSFTRFAVSSHQRDGLTPCGMCRQTLYEFCDSDLEILSDAGDTIDRYTLGELLPNSVTKDMIID